MAQVFENVSMHITLSRMLSIEDIERWGFPKVTCENISSEITMTCGWRSSMAAISPGFSTRWPFGLWGVFMMTSFVLGVMSFSRASTSNCQSGFVSGVCFMTALAYLAHTSSGG